MGKDKRWVRTVGDGDIDTNAQNYAAVFDGSVVGVARSPHLAMWATNIAPSSTVRIEPIS